jgi:dTDP-glucose 4,6-dehydratase
MRLLVTGGAGFIGSNFIRYLYSTAKKIELVNLDALTYAGNLENLDGLEQQPGYRFVRGSIADRDLVFGLMAEGFDGLVHFAAETHVDRSIHDSSPFLTTNVLGTQVLLEAARKHKLKRFLHVSTDEVYGPLINGSASESSSLNPSSPYAASKAAADFLVLSYHHTYGLPVLLARCSNNYGRYQFPEKLIPVILTHALNNQPIPIYGDGTNVRDWLHVEDNSAALYCLLTSGKVGEIYNVGGNCTKTNLEVVELILQKTGRPRSLIKFVPDRPGHDYRYALNCEKIERELGWQPQIDFEKGVEATIAWYGENRSWWERIISGEYQLYYQKQYAARFKA